MHSGALYVVADAIDGRPIGGADIEFFGFKQQNRDRQPPEILTANFAESTGADGQAAVDGQQLLKEYQWIAVARQGRRLAFLGFDSIWYGADSEDDGPDGAKVFGLTDRPVYRPGQMLHWKIWVAQARYDAPMSSKYAGKSFKVNLSNPRGESLFEKTCTADIAGGFDGDSRLPDDAALGDYTLSVVGGPDVIGGVAFRVEEYKKPEFEVTVAAPTEPVALGDKFTATIKAAYYFGGPVTQAQVNYTVTRSSYSDRWYPVAFWDWCFGPGYWWFWPNYTWYPGWSDWGLSRPQTSWMPHFAFTRLEVVAYQTVPIGADGTVAVHIDTAMAKELHGDSNHRYEIRAEVVDQSRRTIVGSGEVLVARKPFDVFAWTDRGYYRAGDAIEAQFAAQTLDHKPVAGKGVITLYRVTYGAGQKPIETPAQTWNVDPDAQGQAHLQIKASEPGQYRLAYKVTDAKQRTIEGAVVLTILGQGFDSAKFRFNDLELIADRREYKPGERVRLLINTNHPDSTVFLFLRPYQWDLCEAADRASRRKERCDGDRRAPGRHAQLFCRGVHDFGRPPLFRIMRDHRAAGEADRRRGGRAIRSRLQARRTSQTRIKLTDRDGKPVRGSIVVSVYDKSVEYISGGSNLVDIRKFFWEFRRTLYPTTESSLDRTNMELWKRDETPMSDIGLFGAAGRFGSPIEDKFADETGVMFKSRGSRQEGAQLESPAPVAMAGTRLFDATGGGMGGGGMGATRKRPPRRSSRPSVHSLPTRPIGTPGSKPTRTATRRWPSRCRKI